MVSRMISLALLVIASLECVRSQHLKYPADVNPNLCPDYPHCDNVVLGAHATAVGAAILAAAPRYVEPSYEAAAYEGDAYAAPAYRERGYTSAAYNAPAYPERAYAAPSYAAPAYPERAYGAPTYATPAKEAHGDHDKNYVKVPVHKGYPAGLDPKICPNYPYCGPTPKFVPVKGSPDKDNYAYNADAAPGRITYAAPKQITYAAPTQAAYFTPSRKVYATPAPVVYAAPVQSEYGAPAQTAYQAQAHNTYAAPASKYPAAAYSHGTQGVYTYSSTAEEADRFPAAIDPNTCPNYPFCH